MKKILCFGDSNTFGHLPFDGSRMQKPWPKVLQELMPDCEIIEEGLCGRTTAFDVENPPLHNGLYRFEQLLNEGKDADIFIIMLGTNDTLKLFDKTANESKEAMREYIHKWRERFGQNKKILIISPIYITEDFHNHEYFNEVYPAHAVEKSHDFAQAYSKLASEEDTYFLDAALYAQASKIDGIHMEPDEHIKLAKVIYKKLKDIV